MMWRTNKGRGLKSRNCVPLKKSVDLREWEREHEKMSEWKKESEQRGERGGGMEEEVKGGGGVRDLSKAAALHLIAIDRYDVISRFNQTATFCRPVNYRLRETRGEKEIERERERDGGRGGGRTKKIVQFFSIFFMSVTRS